MKKWLFIALAFLLPLSSLAAQDDDSIEDVFERGCGDDNGTDRCDQEIQDAMLAQYDWESAETLVANGVTFRRMMFVDGYGRDVGGIVFYREPGQSPRVRVESPNTEVGPKLSELSAAISQHDWDRVISNSTMFEQQLVREVKWGEVPSGEEFITLCLHGWFVVAEAGDAAKLQSNLVGQRMEAPKIRRDAEGACADGMTVPFAFNMADFALDLLPECQSIPRNSARNTAQLLANCHRLVGDRLAAADAMQIVTKLERYGANPSSRKVEWLLAASASEKASTLQALLASGDLYLGLPGASDADHASVSGRIMKFGNDEDAKDLAADISFELVRQTGDFVVASFNATEFREID